MAKRLKISPISVIIVLIVLAAALSLSIKFTGQGLSAGSQRVQIKGHIEQYRTLLLFYHQGAKRFPTPEQGLAALIQKPATEPIPSKWWKLAEEQLIDPFGQPYHYRCPGLHNPHSYDIFSSGSDKKPGTPDDVGNWEAKN